MTAEGGSARRRVSARLEKHLLRAVTGGCRPMARTDRFGVIEALGYGSELDHWMRYASVVTRIADYLKQVDGRRPLRVLDVGGGPAGVASLLRDRRFQVVAIDPNAVALRGNRALKVVGDGCQLPLAARSIDVVVSVDSLEHVPSARRLEFLQELDRVARGLIIIHCPLDGLNRQFQGTRYDRIFQRLHRRYFHSEEANTVEHLREGLPTVDLVRSVFPGVSIHGLQNGRVWVQHMIGGRRRWWRLINGLRYLWVLKPSDQTPPFHGALMVVDRGERRTAPSEGRRATVSAVVLTKNEASRVARCLASVQWMPEVVVVDGLSTDRTVEIGRAVGARVIQRAFGGSFAEERNAGLAAATGDWVLQLDADDVVTPGMRRAIEAVLRADDASYAVYKFRRRSIFLGRRLRFGGWAPYAPHFVRRLAVRYEGRVHEQPVTSGRVGVLDAEIDHYFCDRYEDLVGKLNRYSTLEVEERDGHESHLSHGDLCATLLLRPLKLFWKIYLKKSGYRDGLPGLIMALHNSWSHVIIAAKRWERVAAPQGLSPTLTERLDAINCASSLEAAAWGRRGGRRAQAAMSAALIFRPAWAFWGAYLRQRGYRRGWEGVCVSALPAYQTFVRCVKEWEQQDREESKGVSRETRA